MASPTDLSREVANYREVKRFNHHVRPQAFNTSWFGWNWLYTHHTKISRINSLEIRNEGDVLATSGEDDFIHLYDAITGLYVLILSFLSSL